MSVGSMTPTKQRAEVLDFPAVYSYTPASFAVHEASAFYPLDDLHGQTTAHSGGCTYDPCLTKHPPSDAEGRPPLSYAVEARATTTYEIETNAVDTPPLA